MNPKLLKIARISIYALTSAYFSFQAYNSSLIHDAFKSVVSLTLALYIVAMSMFLLITELTDKKQ